MHLEVDGSEVEGLSLPDISNHQLRLAAGEVQAREVAEGRPETVHPHGILIDGEPRNGIRHRLRDL